jgi:hypothetical protein
VLGIRGSSPVVQGLVGANPASPSIPMQLVLLTETKQLDVASRFRRDAYEHYDEAKHSTVVSIAQTHNRRMASWSSWDGMRRWSCYSISSTSQRCWVCWKPREFLSVLVRPLLITASDTPLSNSTSSGLYLPFAARPLERHVAAYSRLSFLTISYQVQRQVTPRLPVDTAPPRYGSWDVKMKRRWR